MATAQITSSQGSTQGSMTSGPATQSSAALSSTAQGTTARAPEGRSTPSRLWLVLIAAVVALLAIGAACATTLASRQASETSAVNSDEHLMVNVDELYHTLADADATAAAALLVSQVPPARLIDQYQSDVAQSEKALAQASRDLAGDGTASSQLEQVATQLPIYTGLVATAQADNRLGYPVGAAYLREASTLLRQQILPEVKAVADQESAAQTSAQAGVGGFPVWLVVVALLAFAALVRAAQVLARMTRRQLNPGLTIGILIALALTLWTLTASFSAKGSSNHAQSDFTAVSAELQARDNLALADSFQSLSLIDRGEDNGQDTKNENAALDAIRHGSALDAQSTNLFGALTKQTTNIQSDVSAGNYYQAIDAAVGHSEQQSVNTMSAKAATLDSAFVDAFNRDQNAYASDSGAAGSSLGGGLWLGLIGGAAAAAAAAYGINRRLAEYR